MSKEDTSDNPYKDYAENTSIGGLQKVLSGSSLIRRLVWLVVLLICIAGIGYGLRNNFKKIVSPPTSTTISTTTLTSLDFPAVTVCNLNIFSASKANEFQSELPGALDDLRQVFNAALEGDNRTCYRLLNQYSGLEYTDFRFLIKTFPQDLISRCRFSGEECDIASEFEPTLTHLGVCFTFNSGRSGRPIRKVNNAGVRNGLQLELKVNQSDYIATFAGDAGIKIAVHPQSEPPLPDDLGIAVPPGNNAFISFTKRTVEDETGINCVKEGSFEEWKFLNRSYSYSQAACLADSFYMRVADRCRCIVSNIYLPEPTRLPYSQQPVCNFADICCNYEQYSAPIKTPCLPACSLEEFPVSTASYSRFPASYRNETNTGTNGSENLASANIFFETLTIENQYTEFDYGTEEFLAELGGHLTLFIGANIIGLFELLFFLFDAIKYCVVRKPCKKSTNSVELTEFTPPDDALVSEAEEKN